MVKRISISLPEHSSEIVDEWVASKGISRSQLFTQLIETERRSLLERELAEGYKAMMQEHRSFAEMAINIAEEVWSPYETSSPT